MGRTAVAAAITRLPREFVASVMAAGATVAILVNALFLQHGPHPAPIFATRSFVASAAQPGHKGDRLVAPRVAAPQSAPAPARQDPFAVLIAPSMPRLLAIQHALADFGYGQIKPTGVLDRDT